MNYLYKIYFDNGLLVYLGRTRQKLQDRLRGHFFAKPMHRFLDARHVTKIEYAECKTISDMYLYEIYYINKLKPGSNTDDKASDDLTVTLPELEFKEFECHLMDKWRDQIIEEERRKLERQQKQEEKRQAEREWFERRRTARRELSHEDFLKWLEEFDREVQQ